MEDTETMRNLPVSDELKRRIREMLVSAASLADIHSRPLLAWMREDYKRQADLEEQIATARLMAILRPVVGKASGLAFQPKCSTLTTRLEPLDPLLYSGPDELQLHFLHEDAKKEGFIIQAEHLVGGTLKLHWDFQTENEVVVEVYVYHHGGSKLVVRDGATNLALELHSAQAVMRDYTVGCPMVRSGVQYETKEHWLERQDWMEPISQLHENLVGTLVGNSEMTSGLNQLFALAASLPEGSSSPPPPEQAIWSVIDNFEQACGELLIAQPGDDLSRHYQLPNYYTSKDNPLLAKAGLDMMAVLSHFYKSSTGVAFTQQGLVVVFSRTVGQDELRLHFEMMANRTRVTASNSVKGGCASWWATGPVEADESTNQPAQNRVLH